MRRACLLFLLFVAAPARAEDVLPPHATGLTRGGIAVVAVSAPGAPWAVVQLHARAGGWDMPPLERASLDALAQALADGSVAGRVRPISADATDLGGVSRWRVGADGLVVALGAPMARLDVLLRGLDERIRSRARLVPATRKVELEPTFDPAVDARALALAVPGQPVALPTSGGADALALRAAADRVLRRDRIVIAVVGPLPPAELLTLVARSVQAPLFAAAPLPATTAPPLLVAGTRLAEFEDADVKGARATLWMLGPGRGSAGALPADRAARAVLARLAGGRVEGTEGLFAIVVDVEAARKSAIARAEGARLQALLDVARAPPPQEAVEAARAQERAARLERLKEPAALADALGRALLFGDAGLVDAELQALLATKPDDVARAAAAAASGPRVIVRRLGGGRE